MPPAPFLPIAEPARMFLNTPVLICLTSFSFVFYVNGNEVITDVTANDDHWHHIALTWTSEGGEWKMYGDGVLLDQGDGLGAGHTVKGKRFY